jgi:hypothetical protein
VVTPNPIWYDMLAAIDDVSVEQQQAAGFAPPVEPAQQMVAGQAQRAELQPAGQHTRLPDFWPHAPGMWFSRAECRFEMLGISSERQQFCIVAEALPYETMRLVADLVAAPPAVRPYSQLKERMLLAHALTPVQHAEKLFVMPQLGARRPSDLLAAMYEFCPPGEENTALFQALFLTRLPPEIRVHVEVARDQPLKELAMKADHLWLTLAAKQQAHQAMVLAAVEEQQGRRGRRGAGGGGEKVWAVPEGQEAGQG